MNKSKQNIMSVHSTYEVRWKNFKGFKDTGWIKIKPITILIGPNNSGKTSFIAPLLIMNQTLSSREDASSPLVLNGNLYEGGNISDVIHHHDDDNEIFLGLKYHTHNSLPKKIKKIGAYPPGSFEITIGKNKRSKDLIKPIEVLRQTIYDMYSREYLSIFKNSKNEFELKGIELNEEEKEIIKIIKPINYLFSPNTFLFHFEKYIRNRHAPTEKEEFSSKKTLSKGYQELLQAIAANYSQARNTIFDISYLGPIRDTPHRYYEIGDEVIRTVGLRGENMARLLKQHMPKKKKEVNKWVKMFGFGDELKINKLYKNLLYSITFKDNISGYETNIADTGFGASQILPLIVQALVSEKESITIAEQPEIHLNPKLQGVLAELFVEMAERDQRVIVETHSEHLLLRLRTLVASKKISPDLIAVYYVEKEDGVSKIKNIPIDENGKVSATDWPKGFFADTLKESLALSVAQSENKN